MALLESFDAEIYDNTFTNVEFGIRISLGGGNNYVHDNVFDTCTKCECANLGRLGISGGTVIFSKSI